MKHALRPPDSGESPAKADDRRAYPRIPAEQLPGLAASSTLDIGLRLIDISKGGALFECRKRVVPGAEVALRLITKDGSHVVRGRVVRTRMIRLETGTMGYQTALAFNQPLMDMPMLGPADQQAEAAETLQETSAPVVEPAVEPAAPPPSAIVNRDAVEHDANWNAPAPVILFTATIGGTSDDLRELFTNNDW